MVRFNNWLAAIATSVVAFPALAQQTAPQTGGEPFYPYPHMWRDGWGWHPGFFMGPFMMLFMVAFAVLVIMMLFRCLGLGGHRMWHVTGGPGFGPRHPGDAIDILEQRFATGEIDQVEFEQKRKVLGR